MLRQLFGIIKQFRTTTNWLLNGATGSSGASLSLYCVFYGNNCKVIKIRSVLGWLVGCSVPNRIASKFHLNWRWNFVLEKRFSIVHNLLDSRLKVRIRISVRLSRFVVSFEMQNKILINSQDSLLGGLSVLLVSTV